MSRRCHPPSASRYNPIESIRLWDLGIPFVFRSGEVNSLAPELGCGSWFRSIDLVGAWEHIRSKKGGVVVV